MESCKVINTQMLVENREKISCKIKVLSHLTFVKKILAFAYEMDNLMKNN